MKFVNKICPICKRGDYMVLLGDVPKAHEYKCLNRNVYFNDIDLLNELLRPVLKSECPNTKIDMVEVVRCKYCEHYKKDGTGLCDLYHTHGNAETWFCADGKRREGGDIE